MIIGFIFDHCFGHDKQIVDGFNAENMFRSHDGKQAKLKVQILIKKDVWVPTLETHHPCFQPGDSGIFYLNTYHILYDQAHKKLLSRI